MNRLISAQNAGTDCTVNVLNGNKKFWGNTYAYDAWGNLVNKTKIAASCAGENLSVTADTHNWIHATGGSDYQYDAAGNMTFNATPPTQTYSYDQENRLTGAAGYAYTYDGDGNRVRKSNGNLATNGTLYWYMTPGIVGESDLSGNLTDEYVFFDGERVARKSTNGVFYYFSDHLKTASVITDASGNIKSESDFYPWGGELQFVNNDSNHYKFTGKERDAETQLDYFGARYYSNGLGRWVSADWSPTPIPVPYADFHDPQSLNLYSYVRNIPTTQVDADGHDGPPTVYEAIDFLNRTFGLGIPTPQPLNAVLPQQGTPPAAQPQNAAPGLTYRDPGIPPANGELRDVLACTQRCANEPIVVTSTRERVPQHPADTPHGRGNAADLRVRPGHEDRVLQCAANCGARFGLNERRHPSGHATGPHVHIQIVPGRSGGRGDLPQPQRPPGRPCIGCGGPPDQRHQREVQEEMRH